MKLTVRLPCKPVVKKYLINRYGENCTVQKNDWVKQLLLSMLQRKISKYDSEITLQYYTESYDMPLNLDEYLRYGDELSKTAIREINNRIEDDIHNQLFRFLEFYVHVCGYRLKDSIEMFQTFYAFPEECYSSDAIKKYYQRRIQPYVSKIRFVGLNVPLKKKKKYHRQKD